MDDIYRSLVKKVRAESQSLSLNEPTEDATYAKEDELKSYEEAVAPEVHHKLQPLTLGIFLNILFIRDISSKVCYENHYVLTICIYNRYNLSLGSRRRDVRLSPLKISPAHSPRHESRLLKQKSEDILIGNNKFLHQFSSFDEDNKETGFDKHPRALEKMELKVTGGGSMFLKSNTRKNESSPGQKSDGLDLPKSILRERAMEHSKSVDFDKISQNDKSDKDDEDKKSVRFNLDNNITDVGITFSDKSSSDEDMNGSDKQPKDEVAPTINKTRFHVSAVPEKKLIKVPPDFVKPKLTIHAGKFFFGVYAR